MVIRQRYVALLLTAMAFVASQASVQAQLDRDPAAVAAYEAGQELSQQEKWEEAIAKYNEAIEIDGTNTYSLAFLGKGDALRALEDYSAALGAYQSAISSDQKLARAYYGRAVCAREAQQFDLAVSDFENAIDYDRNDPEIAADYGDLLINYASIIGSDANKAVDVLDKAIELDPSNAEAFRNRGLAHTMLGDFDEAVADMEKSIELDDSDYKTHARLANVHLYQDEFEPGIESLTRAIETYEPEESRDPDTYIDGYLQRASASLRLGNQEETAPEVRQKLYEDVIADADAVLAEFPDRYPEAALALFRRGLALRMQGKYGEAIKAFTDAIQLVPPGEEAGYLSEAYLKRGICWHYQKQDSLARGDFEHAATLNLEDPLPYLWIGFTYAEEGDFRAAIENYGEAISKNPSFPLAYVNGGLAYIRLGEYRRAIDNFNEAIRSEPNEAEHFNKRGIAQSLLGEHQQAFDSHEHAILRDPDNVQAHRLAAEALRKLDRANLAEQYDRKADALEAGG